MALPKRSPRLRPDREERRRVARLLNELGMAALVPEDDFSRDVGASVLERAILSRADVDLVFVSVESWGIATEFGQFHTDPRIASKLRVLVDPEHHPLHDPRDGYLKDLYLPHLAAYGHVVRVPSKESLVLLMAERYRQLKRSQPNLIR